MQGAEERRLRRMERWSDGAIRRKEERSKATPQMMDALMVDQELEMALPFLANSVLIS